MKDHLISMFIDNELGLDEKIDFVEIVHQDKQFKDETVDLLGQEKLLQGDLGPPVPEMRLPVEKSLKAAFFRAWLPPFAGFAAAMLLVMGVFLLRPQQAQDVGLEKPFRFVIYRPDARQAKIVGTFTDWKPIPLEKTGNGYWTINLNIPEGEHRYSYLVDNEKQIADPTVPAREQDDFGGENSIIQVAAL